MNLSKLLWIIAGLLGVALVGFLGYSLVVKKDTVVQITNEVSEQEIKKEEENNSEGIKPVAQQTTIEYKNTEFGFSLQLPALWKGYKTNVYKVERDNYFTVGVTHPTEKIYPPVDFPSTAKPIEKTYSFIVVPIATWNKWYVTGEGAHPFAAGVGASEFGRNSQYVFAIAPRYYYGAYVYGENVSENDKKEGEQIARSFKVFNPTFKAAQKTNIDWQKEWQEYLPNINFLEMKDITDDGVPEVLVNSFVAQGGSGTSVDKVMVFTIKNNKAVEIPVYENGIKRELSQYSGNVQASRVLFTNEGVEEQQRRSKGLNPGVYEILDSKIVFTYNKNTLRLENMKTEVGVISVTLYTYADANPNYDCSAVKSFTAQVPKTTAIADASLRTLFSIEMPLNRFGTYDSVKIENGIAKVFFYEKMISYSSCESAQLRAIIEKTLTQYPTIQKVELYRASDRSKIEF